MKLTNDELIRASRTLNDLDLSFPIRSTVRVNRAQKALEDEAQKIQKRRKEINAEHRVTNEEGEDLFTVVLEDGETEEMTREQIQNHEDLDQSTQVRPSYEDEEERQEKLMDLMQAESDVDTDDLPKILADELDAIQEAFQKDRVSAVMETITQATDLLYDERQEIKQGLENELAGGVSLSDTKAFSFLFPLEDLG